MKLIIEWEDMSQESRDLQHVDLFFLVLINLIIFIGTPLMLIFG